MASIEGGNNGVSGVGAGQSGSGSDGISAAEMASNLIGSSTGPAGLETDRLAASVDMAMQSISAGTYQGTGMTDGFSAADLQAAVMSQLGPRQQGQFQSSLDTYKASPFTTAAQQLAVDLPLRQPTGQPGMNTAQDPYGTEVPTELPQFTMSSTDTAAHRFAELQRQQRADGMRQVELITSGPFSGLFAAGGVIAGAEMHTIEGLAKLGEMADGFTTPLSP